MFVQDSDRSAIYSQFGLLRDSPGVASLSEAIPASVRRRCVLSFPEGLSLQMSIFKRQLRCLVFVPCREVD